MSLWRLEWLRLARTGRLAAVAGVYLFFGLIGPLTARYLADIVERFGGDVQVTVPPPVPADGVTQYVGNAQQLGLLVVVLVAAAALAIDARPAWAVFLRTRAGAVRLLAPRYLVTAGVAAAAFVLGTAAAWYETAVLLGGLPAAAMVAGTAYGVLFLAFAVAVVAAVATWFRGVLATAGISVVVLLVLPLIGLVPAVGEWLPSHLVGALDDLVRGGSITGFLPAAAVTVAATAGLLAGAVRWSERREL